MSPINPPLLHHSSISSLYFLVFIVFFSVVQCMWIKVHRLKGSLQDYTPKHGHIIEDEEAVVPTKRTRSAHALTSSHHDKPRRPTLASSSLKKKKQERAAILEKIWKSGIPSRKRSSVSHRSKRFQMDLSYVLKYGVEDSAILSREHEEDHVLINNANNLMISPNEIGIGCILLKDNKHTPIVEYLNGYDY